MRIPVSVVILTRNESADLPGCLSAASNFTDDVIVLDSGSTDQTVAIARHAGVEVFENEFTGFGDQRNWAIDHIPHKYKWSLHLDADERPTAEFLAELSKIVDSDTFHAGFFVPNKLMFGNRWLRYCSGYPVYQVRLFRLGELRFSNFGHGQKEVTDGMIGFMKNPYLHYAFSKGLQNWFEKHARYAADEARQVYQQKASFGTSIFKTLSGDPVVRRRAIKELSFFLPCRGILRLIYLLVFKRGILDGHPGITYARMIANFDTMCSIQLAVLKRHSKFESIESEFEVHSKTETDAT